VREKLKKLRFLILISILVISQVTVIRAQTPESSLGGVNLLDSYEYRVPYDTITVDDSPKELRYDLELDIQPWSGALEGTGLTITNPFSYSTNDVSGPEPTSLDPYLYWDLGAINEGERVDVHWHIPEKTTEESLGFSVTKDVYPTSILEVSQSISQTTTIDVTHYDVSRRLHVVVEYRQDLVDAFVDSYSHAELAHYGDGWIEWILFPGHDQQYSFTVTFDVQRKTGVNGEIEVFPQCRIDSRSSNEFQGTSVNVPLDAGDVTITTSNTVSWNINDEDGKILWFEGMEQAPLGNLGHLGLLQYHHYWVSAETAYVDSDPKDLTYSLHLGIGSASGTLEGTGLTITNPEGWPTDEVRPDPTTVDTGYMFWNIGTIEEHENRDFFWPIRDKTYYESLGFSVTRNIDTSTIPEGVASILQTTTLDVTHLESEKELWAGVDYMQELVTVELIDYSHQEFSYAEEGRIDWCLSPGHEAHNIFWATYRLTRKPGIQGEIEVYPGGRTDSRAVSWVQSPEAIATIEIGMVEVTTTNSVDWEIRHEYSKTLYFNNKEEWTSNGRLNLLQYHECIVPYDTTHVGTDPVETSYILHLGIESLAGTLEGTTLNFADVSDWTDTEHMEPVPSEVGADFVYWGIGDLVAPDRIDVFWADPEKTYSESLDFSVIRSIDTTVIPEDQDSILQTVTLEITPTELDRVLCAGVSYLQEIVNVEIVDYNFEEYAHVNPGGEIEWYLNPPLVETYTFWATYSLTRKPGIQGEIEVYPGGRTDSRVKYTYAVSGANRIIEAIEVATVDLAISNIAGWEVQLEHSKTLWFEASEIVLEKAIQVRINDWYSTVTDPSYEQVYEDIVTSQGPFYSHGKTYDISISWSGIVSNEITVIDKLKPDLQLEASIIENPPPYGCGDISYSYNPETGDVELHVVVQDKREGKLTVQWEYLGPNLELDVYKNPPHVNRVSNKIRTDASFKVSSTMSALQLNYLDTLAYMVKRIDVWTDSTLYPSLLHVRPEPTSTTSGGGWGQLQWFYEENPVTPGRIPLDEYYESCHSMWDLYANGELQVTNSFLIRYVGEGNDLPTILRDGAFKTIVTCDSTEDTIQGWESVPNWHFLKKAGPVRSVFNLHVFQPAASEKELKIFNPTVNSHVILSNTLTEPYYELRFSTYVNDADGLDDIDYVKVIYPDGTEQYLLDEYYDFGVHPPGDGEYFNIIPVGYQITGEFTFVVVDKEGNLDQSTALLDEWLPPFDWVYPSFGDEIPVADFYFNWDLPISPPTAMQKYEIRLGYEGAPHPGFWQTSVAEPPVEYIGSYPLSPGGYWWWITGWSQKGNIVVLDVEFQLN